VPPGVEHAIYTVSSSVVSAHHFYLHATMELTIRERFREHQEEDMDKMNERVPQAHVEICLMAIQWADETVRQDYVGPNKLFSRFLLILAYLTLFNADPAQSRLDR
jgi:hypothetical protein